MLCSRVTSADGGSGRARFPVYAFTNISRSAKTVFASPDLGLREPRGIEALTARIGACPSTILFFDDLPNSPDG